MKRIKWNPLWNAEAYLYDSGQPRQIRRAVLADFNKCKKTLHEAYEAQTTYPVETAERLQSIEKTHTLPKDILFECGTGSGFVFASEGVDLTVDSPCRFTDLKTIGQISIDAALLSKPRIVIDFSCIVHQIPNSENSLTQLEFTLFRSCSTGHNEPLGTWQCSKAGGNAFAQAFSLMYCDHNVFADQYHYSVRVNSTGIRNSCVFITNSHITAVAQ